MYSGMPRTNECFPVYTVGGRIGPDELMSSSNSTFFSLSLFPPPSLPSVFTSVDDKRIGSNANTISFHRRRNTLDCFFFLFRGSIYPVESDSLQFPKCNQRNGAWNSIAVTCYFQRFSEPFESEECTNCYHLKLVPDTSLENCIWQRNEGVIPATQIFSFPTSLFISLPPFCHRSILLLPSLTSFTDPSCYYSISFFALPPPNPFFRPLPFSYIVPNPPSYFHPPPLCSTLHLSTVHFFFSFSFRPYRSFPSLFSLLSQFRLDTLCADGPMGFRKAFATGFFFHLVPSGAQDMPGRGHVNIETWALFVLSLLCIFAAPEAILTNDIKVKNGRPTDIFGFTILAVLLVSSRTRDPLEFLSPALTDIYTLGRSLFLIPFDGWDSFFLPPHRYGPRIYIFPLV